MKFLTTFLSVTLLAALTGCGPVVIQGYPEADGGAGDAASVTDRPATGDAPLPPVDRPEVIDRPPVPTTCTRSADCGGGRECLGGEGCAVPWTCQPALGRPCTADYSPFCGCDGVTFRGSSTCPSRPFAFRGECGSTPPPVDAGPPPRSCRSTVDCTAGTTCMGPQGCGIRWTCQPSPPCTRDLATYCACDGSTFMASSSCPGRPYARRGPCGIVPTPDAGPATCVIDGVTCRVGVPCRVGACTVCTCEGDTVGCSVEPGCAMDGGGAPDAGVEPPPRCAAQDARGVGPCAAFFGYAWDGSRCVGQGGCSCAGADCRSLAPSMERCEETYRACPRPL